MIDSRCGLHCTGCSYKISHACPGCIESMGHPFHGKCMVAACCQDQGLDHCGQCGLIPCDKLYAYSYLDPEHGDRPPGARVDVCRTWAAEKGIQAWSHVLLTSAGWFNDTDNRGNTQIRNRFLAMLEKPARESKVLFIPTAAIDEESQRMVERCKNDLLHAGILPQNITVYDLDGLLTDEEAMTYDVLYFTGGNTGYLLRRIKETGFDAIIRKMVHGNKVYVGVSAGSIIAARDISTATCTDMAPDLNGLALLHAYLSVHCPEGTQPRNDLPLPHIPLTNNQALAVSYSGYERISG